MNREDNHKALDTFLTESMDTDVPPEVETRLRRRLDDFRMRMTSAAAAAPAERSIPILRHWRRALAIAIPAAAVLLVGYVVIQTFGGGNGSYGYAAVVEKLRKMETLSYTMDLPPASQVPGGQVKFVYKNPGLIAQIMQGGQVVTVFDLQQKAGIVKNSIKKEYVEIDLANMPDEWRPAKVIEDLVSLPDRASEELGIRELDGRKVRGYLVTEKQSNLRVWVDPASGDLVRVEGEFFFASGMTLVMKDFQFNPEVDDSLFALKPPAGFRAAAQSVSLGKGTEQDLVYLLRWWATYHKSGRFPPTLVPGEILPVLKAGRKSGEFRSAWQGSKEEGVELGTRLSRAILFITFLKPENDWHYAGKGVKLGESQTPIAWWKPEGSETCRVIYGDLTIADVAPDDLPAAPENP